ncbi:Thiol-disulfide oxidoreductase YkuV [compost metagenome]
MTTPSSFSRRTFGAMALAAVAAVGISLASGQFPGLGDARAARTDAPAPPLDGATTWLNSSPLTLEQLRGRVVLVDFWTYSCINCINTLPYVRKWVEKYKDQGLTVIGVHTPEFPFEKDVGNVRDALKRFKLTYPIAVDNDYKIWRAFQNNYWPALYFIDANGRIRHYHVGEGDYEQSEQIIQSLLKEAKAGGAAQAPAAAPAQ